MILQIGVTVYKAARGGGAWTSFRTASTDKPCAFCDFNGQLVYVHPDDGVRTYTGAADASANTTVKGRTIAVWQNKVWVGSDVSPTVWWSNVNDAATWTTATDFNKFREKDDKPIKALFPSSGLLVWKQDSFYRVNDSTTGAYQTVDWQLGALSQNAVAAGRGRIYVWTLSGPAKTDGLAPLVPVSDRFRSYFSLAAAVQAPGSTYISAAYDEQRNRIFFAVNKSSNVLPDALVEINAASGAITIHQISDADATACYLPGMAAYRVTDGRNRLVALTTNKTTATTHSVAEINFTGTDGKDLMVSGAGGFVYESQVETSFIAPDGSSLVRILAVRFIVQKADNNTANYKVTLGPYFGVGLQASWTVTVTIPNTVGNNNTFVVRPYLLGREFLIMLDDLGVANVPLRWKLAQIEIDWVPVGEAP
jgi:hypothetical protein